jgi:hypothetical protein
MAEEFQELLGAGSRSSRDNEGSEDLKMRSYAPQFLGEFQGAAKP